MANLEGNTKPAPERLAKIDRRLAKKGDQRGMAKARSRKQEGIPDSLKKEHRGAPYGPGCPGLR
ncbi:hypothetical protein amyaer_p04810 (plasmid) [Microcystis aeruginosa NIES-2481]|uniref:hypothetical protein n=1 Tax=Microcystis aeruginosa TaxID=1126 RepID=UPI000CA22FF5|nr:hypothetical protein [Microcystis aeruginosa]AUS35921.1 hypothetical protein amyaer_p04810 [Microcystis aeruginosa NIES-2481]